jgi:hypothetical protein
MDEKFYCCGGPAVVECGSCSAARALARHAKSPPPLPAVTHALAHAHCDIFCLLLFFCLQALSVLCSCYLMAEPDTS